MCDCSSGGPVFNIGKDIHSLTDFKRRTSELVAQLQQTKRPIVLTVNGRPAVIVQDAETYQRLLEELETGRREPQKERATGGRS